MTCARKSMGRGGAPFIEGRSNGMRVVRRSFVIHACLPREGGDVGVVISPFPIASLPSPSCSATGNKNRDISLRPSTFCVVACAVHKPPRPDRLPFTRSSSSYPRDPDPRSLLLYSVGRKSQRATRCDADHHNRRRLVRSFVRFWQNQTTTSMDKLTRGPRMDHRRSRTCGRTSGRVERLHPFRPLSD